MHPQIDTSSVSGRTIGLVTVTFLIGVGPILLSWPGLLRCIVSVLVAVATAFAISIRSRRPIEAFLALLVLAGVAYFLVRTPLLAIWIWAVAVFVASYWLTSGRRKNVSVAIAVFIPVSVVALKGQSVQAILEVGTVMLVTAIVGFWLSGRVRSTVQQQDASVSGPEVAL